MRAFRKEYDGEEVHEEAIIITEVTDTRVIGIQQWDNERGESKFDVKRQPNNRFFKGSGSGKITYHLKE